MPCRTGCLRTGTHIAEATLFCMLMCLCGQPASFRTAVGLMMQHLMCRCARNAALGAGEGGADGPEPFEMRYAEMLTVQLRVG